MMVTPHILYTRATTTKFHSSTSPQVISKRQKNLSVFSWQGYVRMNFPAKVHFGNLHYFQHGFQTGSYMAF